MPRSATSSTRATLPIREVGHPPVQRALLRAWRGRVHQGRCRPARVCRRERDIPETPHHPHQVLRGEDPEAEDFVFLTKSHGGDRSRRHAERPGRDQGCRRQDPQQGPPPAHGCLCNHRHGQEQLHEDILCVLHEDAEVRAPHGRPPRRVRAGAGSPAPGNGHKGSSTTLQERTGLLSSPSSETDRKKYAHEQPLARLR